MGRPGAPGPVEAFKREGADVVVADGLDELLSGMQKLSPGIPIDAARVRLEIEARDRELANDFTKDAQITALRQARKYLGDRLIGIFPALTIAFGLVGVAAGLRQIYRESGTIAGDRKGPGE